MSTLESRVRKPAVIASSCLHLTVYPISHHQLCLCCLYTTNCTNENNSTLSESLPSKAFMVFPSMARANSDRKKRESLSSTIQRALCLKHTEAFTSKPLIVFKSVLCHHSQQWRSSLKTNGSDPSLYWLTSVSLTCQPYMDLSGGVYHLPSFTLHWRFSQDPKVSKITIYVIHLFL